MLTTPADVAQELTDRVVAAGVKAIWNFTPGQLRVPPGVLVRNEHISLGLSQIAHHLKESSEEGEAGARADDVPVPVDVRGTTEASCRVGSKREETGQTP